MAFHSCEPVSIAICDDELTDLEKIELMTKQLLSEKEIEYRISKYNDPSDLMAAIQAGEQFHILLLDVMMEQLDGMELAEALRKQGNKASIIFISYNREMALKGYEVAASRFLSKPLDKEKLKEALLFCCRTEMAQKEILLPAADGRRRILLENLIYAEPWDRGTRLILLDGDCKTGVKISELGKILPKDKFVFCHRTLLVNLGFIQSIRYCELTLKNGQILPVSKYRQAKLKESFLHYLRE